MINKKLFIRSSIEKMEDNADEKVLKISGYASTTSTDRVGDIILASAWEQGGLNNFIKNPILLFNHNYDKPIGKVVDYYVDSRGLMIIGEISKSNTEIYNLIKDGVLRTFSVGFMIKDADYDRHNDGLIIKNAELLEVSVVSVPCNQDATFSVAKSFNSDEEYLEYRKQFEKGSEEDPSLNDDSEPSEPKGLEKPTGNKMTPEEIKEMMKNLLSESEKARKEAEEAAAAKAKADAEEAEKAEKAAAKVFESSAEKLYAELEKRFADEKSSLEEKLAGITEELNTKSEELVAIANSKKSFGPRNEQSDNWKKAYAQEADNAYLLGRITGKGYETEYAKTLLEKVNAHSSIEVSSADFEQEVSTNIERDIENELILQPLFREVNMNTASMIVPIMPDVGYAEITSAAGSTDATAPHGTLDERGGTNRAGANMTEIELRTVKMVAKSYLGDETEEDAILPILPLLRDSMIRQHARGVENMILLAGHTDGAYSSLTTGAQGLLKYASTNSRSTTNSGTVGTLPALTASALLTLRKNMGKYGIKANDVIYVVSQRGYFELLEDAEFQDFNLVGNQATKLTGEVGQIFGSSVMLCDEFPDAAADKFYACALNKRNFITPRQRGVRVQSEYSVEDQHRVLVTSQRLGFREIIPNAKSVFGLAYPAAS